MENEKLLKQLVNSNPVRNAGPTRRNVLKGIGAGAGVAALGAGMGMPRMSAAAERDLAMLTWDGYVDQRVIDGFTEQHDTQIKYELHTSDPDSVNKLRAGQTAIWDIINLNNPWAREMMVAGGSHRRASARPLRALFRQNAADVQAALQMGDEPG